MNIQSCVARWGDFLRDHAAALRKLQWLVVAVYLFLLIVPACLPLPDETAHVFNNLTIAAQFAFWGIWWPFVLLSMLLLGRAWCGWLCPEGMLSEWASERGRGGAIPRWVRWSGWPFVAFALTTIYGQLVSVYQYPKPVVLILGGSTLAAMVIGYLYGRSKRVWCRYLCPVNGVFNLLARLAPWHYRVDATAWQQSARVPAVNCAPLLPLRNLQGAGACHMCGRCSGHRGAITLALRSPESEIIETASASVWETRLIVFGLMGIATGAFQWSSSPWYVAAKQWLATWLVGHEVFWPLEDSAPWWLLTHYPQVNDSFSWLDGALVLAYIGVVAVLTGGVLRLALWLADRVLPARSGHSVHQLALGLVPLAGCGVFLGLTATTLTLLRHEGWATGWAGVVRTALLAGATLWTIRLLWRIAAQRAAAWPRQLFAMALLMPGLLLYLANWGLLFYVW